MQHAHATAEEEEEEESAVEVDDHKDLGDKNYYYNPWNRNFHHDVLFRELKNDDVEDVLLPFLFLVLEQYNLVRLGYRGLFSNLFLFLFCVHSLLLIFQLHLGGDREQLDHFVWECL